MRFNTLTLLRSACRTHTLSTITRRPLTVSANRLAGKEDALHHEGRHEEAEHHKQDQLRKQKEGTNHWKPELASNSEEAVTADRNTDPATKENIENMQKQTREHVHEKHGQK